jgi:hypothetical protein
MAQMKPRISLLNLLLCITVLSLMMVIVRLYGELSAERALRLEQLRHGGILQVSDLDAVHLVKVSAVGERNTVRWRIYVPKGRTAVLNTRLESMPASKALQPRIPPDAIVVADRSPSNPISLQAGEYVVSAHCADGTKRGLEVTVAGAESNEEQFLSAADASPEWWTYGQYQDITHIEHSKKTYSALDSGRTVKLAPGKAFVLERLREWEPLVGQNKKPSDRVGEMLMWIHPD